jgi:hypothetical protein
MLSARFWTLRSGRQRHWYQQWRLRRATRQQQLELERLNAEIAAEHAERQRVSDYLQRINITGGAFLDADNYR